jgi:hypothetical protein
VQLVELSLGANQITKIKETKLSRKFINTWALNESDQSHLKHRKSQKFKVADFRWE